MTSLMRRSRGWAPGPKSCSPAPPKVTRRKDGLGLRRRGPWLRRRRWVLVTQSLLRFHGPASPKRLAVRVRRSGEDASGSWVQLSMMERLRTTLRQNSKARLYKYCYRVCGVVDIDHTRTLIG